jgi:hypothetical protein
MRRFPANRKVAEGWQGRLARPAPMISAPAAPVSSPVKMLFPQVVDLVPAVDRI